MVVYVLDCFHLYNLNSCPTKIETPNKRQFVFQGCSQGSRGPPLEYFGNLLLKINNYIHIIQPSFRNKINSEKMFCNK